MSTLKETIQEDMKAAMRAKDKPRLDAIRLILAALKQREVDERITLTDQDVIEILDKMQKQRRDSANQYQQAGRNELAEQELFEIEIIQAYLPQPLTEDEISALIKTAIADTGASSMKDMGKVMAELKPKLQGRADMGAVSKIIKATLN